MINTLSGIPASGVPIINLPSPLNTIGIADPSIGWIWVDPNQKFKSVTGVVTESFVTHTDFPTSHDSHDQNTHILVDPGFENLLSIANDPGELEIEWETGIRPSELKGDGANPIFPKWVWPSPGDRVWIEGNWIYDAGHPTKIDGINRYRSEIHPPRAFATMRDRVVPMPSTGNIPIRITATDLYIHGDGGYATEVLHNPNLVNNGGHSTRTSPIDVNFDFDILLPPKPSETAILTSSIDNGPGNTVNIDPVLTPDLANNKVHVHIPLAGSGLSLTEVYARHINVGWVFPTTDLRHFRLTLTKMDLHEDMDTDPGDAELTFSWVNVDKAGNNAWKRLSDFAKGNMNDYDDDQGFGNGEMNFNGPTFDFYVADGQTAAGEPGQIVSIKAHAYDQDGTEALFGNHAPLRSLIPSLLRAYTIGAGDNDKYNVLNHSFEASGRRITNFKVANPGNQYELFFRLEELPLTPAEVNKSPLVNANGPYVVEQGKSINLVSTGSGDPDGSITAFQWDFNYDGVNFQVDATGELPNFLTTGLGASTRTIALRVIDNLGVPAIATSTLTITPKNTSGQRTFVINLGDSDTISNFGGVGKGNRPDAATIADADTLKFQGSGLTARNMLLMQQEQDLQITFEDADSTKAILKDFALENLDNLTQATGASVDLGNILFEGQETIQDSFDVFDADSTRSTIWRRDSVTFLNNLDNQVEGFDDSDDVINGQGGNDTLSGLSGEDLLRGSDGNDVLVGGFGVDTLVGGNGEDILDGGFGGLNELTGGANADTFVLRRNQSQFVTDFQVGEDKFSLDGNLHFNDLSFFQVFGATAISVLADNATIAVVSGVNANVLNSASNFT